MVPFGKYRLIAELGQGGMADVYLAVVAGPVGSGFSKLTVVKRLRQNLAEDPEYVAMLVDEARIAGRLNHPNIVQTNEVGCVGTQYFLSMEYLDGQPLHRIQNRAQTRRSEAQKRGEKVDPFPRDLQYLILMDALAGLHHAHELVDYDGTHLQVVHRDVTPHNIFITYEGQVKVVDFGIAKALGRASETREGVIKGKVRYMAPEQAIGQAVDRRADIFSIGVLLWETATGRRLWKDLADVAILQHLMNRDIPSSPKAFDASVPDAIDAMCRKALAANPADRFQTAEEFRTALARHLAESGTLVDGARELGRAVSHLFTDRRDEIRAVIEKQLTALETRAPNSESTPIQLMASQPPRSTSTPVSANMNLDIDHSASVPLDAPTELYMPGTLSRGRKVRLALLSTLGVGVAAALAVFVLRSAGVRPQAAKPAPAVQSAVAPEADLITVRLNASPPSAVVTLDGVRIPNPYEVRAVRDRSDHVVRIDAPGFEPRVEKIQFASDLTVVFELVRSPTPQVAAAPRRSTWRPAPAPAAPPPKPLTADPPAAPPPATTTARLPELTAPPARGTKLEVDNNDPWNR